MILPLHLNYICVFIYMFVHHKTVSVLMYLFMLYNLIFGCTSSWVFFFLYLSCALVIPSLHHCYIFDYTIMFVNIISKLTTICFCFPPIRYTFCLCSRLVYFLYMICYSIFAILIELHSKHWINISLFELVVTCSEKKIHY